VGLTNSIGSLGAGFQLASRQKKGADFNQPGASNLARRLQKLIALHAHRRGNPSPRRFFVRV
jgi:hypothetical protein